MYSYYAGDAEMAEKASIYGALTLYLDFINIFLYVVRLMGMNSRRRLVCISALSVKASGFDGEGFLFIKCV